MKTLRCIFSTLLLALGAAHGQDADPPEVTIGERLFLETRFSQFFAANSAGNANATLAAGDPVMDNTVTTGTSQPGPFAGQSMNCRACHLVDEHNATLKNRTYNDFARRSPIPDRGDGHTVTLRNSPPLVNALLTRPDGLLLHFDGEFATGAQLAIGTLTGRNYGWLPTENAQAIAHIAHIIRDDDGTGDLAQGAGGRYRDVLKGGATIPAEFRLPVGFRIDVNKANNNAVVAAVGRLIDAYMRSLTFGQDAVQRFNASPYDVFLTKNRLPRKPALNETPAAYAKRLFTAVGALTTVSWVTNADGPFTIHNQDFTFGPEELAGLRIFFAGPGSKPATPLNVAFGGSGNCITCHAPPTFTDFRFHNTGATQEEYDTIHGNGTFAALTIPSYAARRTDPNAFLPASIKHPNATGIFASVPDLAHVGRTDLGLWNIFANPDHPLSQARLLRGLTGGKPGTNSALLPKTIGRFKTPGLRDLADSAPYLHTGGKDTIEDVLNFYLTFSAKARAGEVRNPDPALGGMALVPHDVAPLAAFLRALNEDYE
jgi:cytochrome c peroxidase